jgi:predicted extracellular nuclease/methionine-rich copper-binding protein CopC
MAAISLATIGTAYTQDFDTLSNVAASTTNSLTINGWALSEVGTSALNNGQYAVGTGSLTSGDTYSFGSTASTDRALGTQLSGTLTATIGANFSNDTGQTVASLDISYFGEQWRLGATGRNDRFDFQYSLDATSLTTGTWIDANALDFIAPLSTGTVGALDGNAAANRALVTTSITGLSISTGQQFWIRWTDFNATSSDDGLGIDNFSLTPQAAGDTTLPTVISIVPGVISVVDGTTSFTLVITFNEPMNTAIVPTITFPTAGENPVPSIGSPTGGVWSNGNQTYTATFTVTDANIDVAAIDVQISGAADVAGNNMTAATTSDVFAVSQVNPTLSSSTPADNAVSVAVGNDVVLTFSETISIANLAGIELRKVSDNSVVSSAISASGAVLTINPGASLDSATDYYVSISASAITDASGNTFAGLATNMALNFTTVALGTPTITATLDAPAAQNEGNSGQTAYSYTITWSDIAADTTVAYTMSGGGANPATVGGPASDLNTLSGSFGITAGSGTFTLNSISVLGDTLVEPDEQFQLTIDAIPGVTLNQPGLATITNDDTAAAIAISNATITEGNAGTQILTFTVTRTGGNAPFDVDFATSNGTATGGSDYVANSGTLNFAATDTSKTISVTVNGDTVIEANENFTVTLSNATNSTTITTASATGTISNDDFTLIHDIQGAGHLSSMTGTSRTIEGIVTGVFSSGTSRGYYVQEEDADADADIGTSEGIFVFTGAVSPTVAVGQKVQVTGTVAEFRGSSPAPTANNLALTQLTSATATVISSGNALPTAIVIGDTGRNPPSLYGDDAETGVFNAATDAIDFWESVEGMRVTIDNPTAAGPFRNSFGEIMVLASVTIRDTTENVVNPINKIFDFNGERIQIDDDLDGGSTASLANIQTGDAYADITGIVNYAFGFYGVNIDYSLATQTASTIVKETTTIAANADRIRIAGFNVENLSPVGTVNSSGAPATTQQKFDDLAAAIINRLGAPEIVSLQEVQDNDGITNSAVTSASTTLTQLLAAIVAAGGPQYVAIDAPPVDDAEGGAPGGNIRVAYLYDPAAVRPVTGLTLIAPNVYQYNGVRIGDDISPGVPNPDFAATRHSVPMQWETVTEALQTGSTFWTVNNHFSSKGGSGALIGTNADGPLWDEPVNGSATKREGQATAVNTYIDGILGNANVLDNRVIALGDYNDFQFFPVADIVAGKIIRTATGGTGIGSPSTFAADTQVLRSLMEKLPAAERYTYSFDGNAQALDHIMVSTNLYGYSDLDIVHINSEFNASNRLSDHDPSVMIFTSPSYRSLATSGNDTLIQANYIAAFGSEFGSLSGANKISGLNGSDLIEGLAGNDFLSGGIGDDSIDGGADVDILSGDAGDDRITFNFQDWYVQGGEGSDTGVLDATNGYLVDMSTFSFERFIGGSGNDRIQTSSASFIEVDGGAGNDILIGTVSGDLLRGGEDSDLIVGNAGNDAIAGENGNDRMDGGAGNDIVTGGAGNDAFAFANAGAADYDVITDFVVGQDHIELNPAFFTGLTGGGLLQASQFALGGPTAASAQVIFRIADGNGILEYDADGSGAGTAQAIAIMAGVTNLTAADIYAQWVY